MMIAIPTKGRVDRQVTLKNFIGTPLIREVVLCPPVDEASEYSVEKFRGIRVCFVPKNYSGISRTRQWILTELAPSLRQRYVCMLDDDMDFCRRPDMGSPKLEIMHRWQDLKKMLDILETWLVVKSFVHVGLSARQGNNHVDAPFVDATRMMNAFAYDTRALMKLGVEFGRVPVMEDFDLTLQLLRMGKPNRVSYQYCWNQRGSGARGGCSTYRTAKMQDEAARKLRWLHPEYVRVIEKSTKSGIWKGLETRTDVRIQWRRAYEDALAERK